MRRLLSSVDYMLGGSDARQAKTERYRDRAGLFFLLCLISLFFAWCNRTTRPWNQAAVAFPTIRKLDYNQLMGCSSLCAGRPGV